MFLKRVLLVVSIILIFGLCYVHMNHNFDPLSRYPYQNENSRKLIREYLNDEEIEYIIEYDIAPVYFKEYITYDGFNIYHADKYNELKTLGFGISDEDIVDCVEFFLSKGVYEEAMSLMAQYGPLTLRDYYRADIDEQLVKQPRSYDVVIGEDETIYSFFPRDLKEISVNDQTITMREKAIGAFEEMIIHMQEDGFDTKTIVFGHSYIDYASYVELFDEDGDDPCLRIRPGKSEHQLGLAIDVIVNDEIDDWLSENASVHGFKYSDGHLRYFGE